MQLSFSWIDIVISEIPDRIYHGKSPSITNNDAIVVLIISLPLQIHSMQTELSKYKIHYEKSFSTL